MRSIGDYHGLVPNRIRETADEHLARIHKRIRANKKLNILPVRTPKPKCLTTWTEDNWTEFLYKCDTKVSGVRYRCPGMHTLELTWRGPKGGTRRMQFIPGYKTGKNHFEEIVEFLHLIQLRGVNTLKALDTKHKCRHFV